MTWNPDMSAAPRAMVPFLALNHDREVWVAAYDQFDRLVFRTNKLHEAKRYHVHDIDGRRLLEEDEQYARDNEEWRNDWTLWTRGYEFRPVAWLALPPAPETAEERDHG